MWLKLYASICLILLVLITEGCPANKNTSGPRDWRVAAEWSWHVNQVEIVLIGNANVTGQYLESCFYFERLTGIPIRGRMDYIGWRPDDRSLGDFLKIKQWYIQNHNQLCWNENAGTTKLCDQPLRGRR